LQVVTLLVATLPTWRCIVQYLEKIASQRCRGGPGYSGSRARQANKRSVQMQKIDNFEQPGTSL
jgi:hypothetical protein